MLYLESSTSTFVLGTTYKNPKKKREEKNNLQSIAIRRTNASVSRQISTNLDHDSKFENLSSRAAPARTNSDRSDLKYLKTSQKAYHNIMVRSLVLLQRQYRYYFSVRYGTYMESRGVLVLHYASCPFHSHAMGKSELPIP